MSFRLIRLGSIDSTNDRARALIEAGQGADCVALVATEQTAGRGRRGRLWQSPPGNLHVSFLIALDCPPAVAAQMGFVAALAVAETIDVLIPGNPCRLKWPNDVLLEGEKIAGMLLETVGSDWLIAGIGIDVAVEPAAESLSYPATCLARHGFTGDVDAVLDALCHRLGPWLWRWRNEGFTPVRLAWTARAAGIGRKISVKLETETLEGVFSGLDGDGALLLDQGASPPRRILAGDVLLSS